MDVLGTLQSFLDLVLIIAGIGAIIYFVGIIFLSVIDAIKDIFK